MNTKIQKLAGFRDYFAEDIKVRQYVIDTFKSVFEKYGYEPLETPALEPASIFVGELGDEAEKLFFRFKDQGGRDVMLKYDVMTSMCRAVAENINQLILPYKRYQIQSVWRSEKPQKGRFREFTQCDADTIGSPDINCDAEFIQMGIEVLSKLGFEDFRVNINNRKLMNGIIQYVGAGKDDFIPICISIDKLPKIGSDAVEKELVEKRKISPEIAKKILELFSLQGDSKELIEKFRIKLKDIKVAQEGIEELTTIFSYLQTVNIDKKFYRFAPYIARGLAYYTGPVWEFEILEGQVGSVAGCGRYDDIISKFVNRPIPATGGSFGLERLVEIIKERKMFQSTSTPTKIIVTVFDNSLLANSIKLADYLRKNNFATLLYPVTGDRLDKQLKYANKKQIPYVAIIGPDEAAKNRIRLKNMLTGEQKTVDLKELTDALRGNK